ncbi:MAG: DUF4062 domain-containing protein [Anaerolineae bacterium]|nr:DUF4062 domain-containing protein [Anaerolineae bacterium]
MTISVYISDTSRELQALRPVLIEQIRQAGMAAVWLDDEEKARADVNDLAFQKIARADAFISILSYRRSWEPQSGGPSLAEIEYRTARSMGKPLTVLLPASNSLMAVGLRLRALGQPDTERDAQQRFWDEVQQSAAVAYFHDETDLGVQVLRALNSWSAIGPSAGAAQAVPATAPALAPTVPPPAAPKPEPEPQAAAPGAAPAEAAELERGGAAAVEGLDVNTLAEVVATRTAAKIQAFQQQREEDLAQQAQKYKEALMLHPGELVFGRASDRSQFRSDIFMIMPFGSGFDEIYREIVRPLAADLKLTIARGDEFTSTQGVIMEEVWSALNNCRFVIVEITGGNDNVFYELGIAHTLNKPAILITQAMRPEQIPFNIRHLRYLPYTNTAEGQVKLRGDLKTAITRLLADLQEG